MGSDTRQKILETAKAHFNQHGYNVVSVGDIAGALGISKGNLTYYFQKKEEIIEALMQEKSEDLPATPPETLQELNVYFQKMQRMIHDNAYYFWHHAQLSQLSPRVKEGQDAAYRKNVGLLTQTFQKLQAVGILQGESYLGEYERVVDFLHLSLIYWIPFCQLSKKEGGAASFPCHGWSILYPYLTEKGRAALKEVVAL